MRNSENKQSLSNNETYVNVCLFVTFFTRGDEQLYAILVRRMCLWEHKFFYSLLIDLFLTFHTAYTSRKRTYQRNEVQAQICMYVVIVKIVDDHSFVVCVLCIYNVDCYAKNFNKRILKSLHVLFFYCSRSILSFEEWQQSTMKTNLSFVGTLLPIFYHLTLCLFLF